MLEGLMQIIISTWIIIMVIGFMEDILMGILN